jgi:hypothetical protein
MDTPEMPDSGKPAPNGPIEAAHVADVHKIEAKARRSSPTRRIIGWAPSFDSRVFSVEPATRCTRMAARTRAIDKIKAIPRLWGDFISAESIGRTII